MPPRRWRRAAVAWVLLVAASLAACGRPEPPRVMGAIETYALTASTGEAFGSAELAGAPYVVNFFFTSCGTVCPPIMAEMGAIGDGLAARGNPTRLVSITVDPENDSPARLAEYAKKLEADPVRWSFLTGSYPLVKEVVVKRLMTHMGEAEAGPGGLVDIAHGSHALVIDAAGRLRGVHEPVAEGREDLLDTLDFLASEGR
jgi:protein SCO1/2